MAWLVRALPLATLLSARIVAAEAELSSWTDCRQHVPDLLRVLLPALLCLCSLTVTELPCTAGQQSVLRAGATTLQLQCPVWQ